METRDAKQPDDFSPYVDASKGMLQRFWLGRGDVQLDAMYPALAKRLRKRIAQSLRQAIGLMMPFGQASLFALSHVPAKAASMYGRASIVCHPCGCRGGEVC